MFSSALPLAISSGIAGDSGKGYSDVPTRIALEFHRYKLAASVSERNFDQRQAGVNNHIVALPACSVWISVLEVSVRRDIGQRTLNGTAPLFGLMLGETIVP